MLTVGYLAHKSIEESALAHLHEALLLPIHLHFVEIVFRYKPLQKHEEQTADNQNASKDRTGEGTQFLRAGIFVFSGS